VATIPNSESARNDLLEAALKLAAGGLPVFPLTPKSKIPWKGSKGCLDATRDPAKIEAWWQQEPFANIGVATGKTAGVFVLDVDVRSTTNGEETLRRHEAEHGELPPTREVTTPSTGRHLYFKMPAYDVPCGNGRLGIGLDIKASGGYVLAPPSYVVEKTYRGFYVESVDTASTLAEAPAWLLKLTVAKGPKPPEYWAETIKGVGEGARHETVVSWAGKLVGMGVDAEDVRDFLTWLDSRCTPSKGDPKEIERAIQFALDREIVRLAR
jgi:hypothetical protein